MQGSVCQWDGRVCNRSVTLEAAPYIYGAQGGKVERFRETSRKKNRLTAPDGPAGGRQRLALHYIYLIIMPRAGLSSGVLTLARGRGYNQNRRAPSHGGQPLICSTQVYLMLTAWVPAERSTRFCGQYVQRPCQAQQEPQYRDCSPFPHPPHPLSQGSG